METAYDEACRLYSMETAYDEACRLYSEDFYFQLEEKAGGRDALLALTSGKPRGQVESIVGAFFTELAPEGSAAAALLTRAHQFLFNKEAMLDALEAAPWGDDT
jgi:hypothetical protein